MSREKTESLLNEISQHIKLRLGDVFFSYFIVFEVIFNWKFFYVLLIGEEEKALESIRLADEYLRHTDYLLCIYEKLGQPSGFTLAILCALFMSTIYPWMSFVVICIRKCIFYYMNQKLESDYPTREEFNDLRNKYQEVKKRAEQLKNSRLSDLAYIEQVLIKEDFLVEKEKFEYKLALGTNGSSFNENELVNQSLNNSNIIEKISSRNFSSSRDFYLVVHKLPSDIYIVVRVIDKMPILESMLKTGREYVFFSKNGDTHFVDEKNKKDFLEASDFLFYAKLDRGSRIAFLQKE